MKWFKHLVDSAHDSDLGEAEARFGSDGYLGFFRTLELMAREFKIDEPGVNHFSWAWFKKNFPFSDQKLTKILSFFDQKGRIKLRFYEQDGLRMIRLFCPKLRDLADEYTRKMLTENSGVNPDKLRSIEEEEEYIPPKSPLKGGLDKAKAKKTKAKAKEVWDRLLSLMANPDGVKLEGWIKEVLEPYGGLIGLSRLPRAELKVKGAAVKRRLESKLQHKKMFGG